MAVFVECDPVVAEPAGSRILKEDRPADAAHAANGLEIGCEAFDAAKVEPQSVRQGN